MRTLLKSLVPSAVWNWLGTKRREFITRDDSKKSTREVFERIYHQGLWGSNSESTSGTGSHDPLLVSPYVEAIGTWAAEHDAKNLVAVDIGCGDFHVGARVFRYFKEYFAADIVPSVIENHRSNPDFNGVHFRCLDAIEEDLPSGDVVFVRQVLQHLSNEQIARIVPKLKAFRHAIISEHLPSAARLREKNADKPHGGGIRIKGGSGVYLEAPPFSVVAVETKILLEVPGNQPPDPEGPIRTTYYRFR